MRSIRKDCKGREIMTEEIIIDGVDVSECVSFDKLNGLNICCYDDTREDKIPFANFCIENKDCSYKQLKLKKQECEQLKSKLNKIYNLSMNAFCLTHGTNKDMANFAKQILCLIRKRRMK